MRALEFAELLAERDAEITRLLGMVDRLGEELERANANAAESNARVAELITLVAKLSDRVAELVAAMGRKKGHPAKPPPVASEPAQLDEEAQSALANRPAPPPEAGLLHDRPRPKQVPTGRKALPAHLPRDASRTQPKKCPCGCEHFDWVDEVVEEKLDVQAHQRVRRTQRLTGRCQACGLRSTGAAPPSPFERSKVTCEWLAWMVAQKFELHVALDRLRRSLTAQGLPLAISFFVAQIEAAADILAPIDGVHWKQLLAGDAMATDGTGLKVQVPGAGLHHGYIEVYHHDDIVVFQYEPEKDGATQAAKLATFEGALLIDAESRYNETFRVNRGIVEFNCNAHPRRKLRDAEAAQPLLAAEAGRFVSAMFDAEAEARTEGITGDALREWRQTRIRPTVEAFRRWIDVVKPALLPSDPLRKVLQYYTNHWTELTRFVDDPRVPIDNSGSERAFQAVAKLRLNSLFAGGTEGAHRAAVLLGIAATCRRAGVDLKEYLTWVFVRSGTHRDRYGLSAAELTPAAYKRTLQPKE